MTDNMTVRPATPWWFWLISGLMFLWNLMGVNAFRGDVTMSHADKVAMYGETLANAAANQPGFVTVAYGIAVIAGALGCLLLLLRSRHAFWLLALSLLCVIIQQAYMWLGAGDVMKSLSAGNKAMYMMIPIVSIFLVWFAKKMTARGILR